MQVLKQEVRDSIIKAATALLYEHGFENTSTRQIAESVGMSVSNLYKYFINKEDIFREIISDYHSAYLREFTQFISHKQDNFSATSNAALSVALFNSIKTDHIRFVLLMDKSAGTPYAGFKGKIAGLLEQHIYHSAGETGCAYIISVIVRHFFDSLVEIAKHYQDDAWAQENIDLLVQYHMNGMAAIYK